jgi:hypothetical protein
MVLELTHRFQGDEMILREVFERFCEESPVTVMVRATLENVLSPQRLDALFAQAAQRQRCGEVLFSTVAELLSLAVCQIRPSLHAAIQAHPDIGVTIKAIYDKVRGIEPGVSQGLVRQTAASMASIIDHMDALPDLLPGYQVKILDGNHFARSERRLKELRSLNAAPLPGQSLVVLDPSRMLAVDMFPCEDGHAQERSLLNEVLPTVQPQDVWVADRNFCTMNFLGGIDQRQAFFVIRQHAQSLRYELIGTRRSIGRVETGTVYEQTMRILPAKGAPWLIRRSTMVLDQPTRDGDQEIHILTNLPSTVDALAVVRLYRCRWTVETAFQELEATLHGELETLAYPRAALFGFCLALVSYNLLSVVKAALRAAHGVEKIRDEVSGYYLADEVAGTWRGMMILLPADFWEQRFADQTPAQLAHFLVKLAHQVRLSAFRKHPRGPKKPPPQPMNKKHRNHVSTARILAARSTKRR